MINEYLQDGYVTHDCPNCNNKCNPTEIDNDKAYCEACEACEELVEVDSLI